MIFAESFHFDPALFRLVLLRAKVQFSRCAVYEGKVTRLLPHIKHIIGQGFLLNVKWFNFRYHFYLVFNFYHNISDRNMPIHYVFDKY